MKPEEQQIAIAEACGWTDIKPHSWHHRKGELWGYRKGIRNLIPDYPNDLNAMHEAEMMLWDTGKAMEFTNQLVGTVCSAQGFRWDTGTPDDHLVYLSHATAAQRAEAFLHTLGKWVEL